MTCGGCESRMATQRDRAALCAVCRHSGGVDPSECRYASQGVPVALRINTGCPAENYPDSHGVVRWARCRWYGVPYPVRVWLWLRHPKHPKPSSFAGCGCLVRLKTWAFWLWAEVNR